MNYDRQILPANEASLMQQRWPLVMRGLHWLLAALILFMLGLGLYMVQIEQEPGRKFELYQWHKTIGAFVFALTALRALCRIFTHAPAHPATMSAFEHHASRIAHVLIYGLSFAMGVTGYVMISSSPLPLPIELFDGVHVPNLVAPDYALSEAMKALHHRLAYLFIGLLVVHVLAALKHHFWDRDDILRQMLPF
ncbi:cytochrome b [Methylovirgula sp. 4M-Z18]|uniref:cytochrome b n=1 Tax=Methylovirgula sp. 4M-Z18 TaxID=2293567 RepID=UPI000E2F4529|nr:cytochrome b [Methylovirgula sp. 4M-Z18]RFB78141.1 cytochrome b [Methylovirgula sp. 4M-Z18]